MYLILYLGSRSGQRVVRYLMYSGFEGSGRLSGWGMQGGTQPVNAAFLYLMAVVMGRTRNTENQTGRMVGLDRQRGRGSHHYPGVGRGKTGPVTQGSGSLCRRGHAGWLAGWLLGCWICEALGWLRRRWQSIREDQGPRSRGAAGSRTVRGNHGNIQAEAANQPANN